MIPKAELLATAGELGLLPTTVEKDYVLGWALMAIAGHEQLSRWFFKGGTCLKKCYFDTYRFSEDLDFTIPGDGPYDPESIRKSLTEIANTVREWTGVDFPPDAVDLKESANKRGMRTFEARMSFVGPLQLPRAQHQRIRFDLTQDELVVDAAVLRDVFHGYSDVPESPRQVRCYSMAEILSEKMRALYQRSGRARDVYDVINLARNLRSEISSVRVHELALKKFAFKELEPPDPKGIIARIDLGVLTNDWAQSLRHQLPVLPPVIEFHSALEEALGWLLQTGVVANELAPVTKAASEVTVRAPRFSIPTPARRLGSGAEIAGDLELFGTRMDRIRYAARNRLLVRLTYHGVTRVVEPYSLRRPRTGNLLLYAFEVQRGGGAGGGIKALKLNEITNAEAMSTSFAPQYLIEL